MEKSKSPEYWEERVAANIWKTYNSMEERNRKLLEFYQDASRDIRNELYDIAEKYSKDGVLSRTDMYNQRHYEKLQKRFEDIILSLGRSTEKTSLKSLQDGFREVYKDTAVGMGDIDYAMPNKKLMEKLLEEPWRGGNFSNRLWKNQKKLVTGLNDILRTGLQQGKTVTEMAVNLHNYMGQGFNECHRLVRSESMHYLNSAAMQRYKDAGVGYVQIWAALDERTCEICGVNGYHGKVYPIDKCPVLPFHPNCRCTIIPCFDKKLIQEYIDKHRKDGIIKSGARITDLFSEEAENFARMYYDEIRSFSTDSKKIAENLGKNETDIRKIKDYLFYDKSLYDADTGTWTRFDPDCAIAQSWQRLMDGKNIKPHDKTLIEHELYEMEIKEKNPGMSHEEAHASATKKYDYRKGAEEYYGNLKKH